LSATEGRVVAKIGLTFLALGLLVGLFPQALAFPLAAVLLWFGCGLLMRAWRLRRGGA
jgi:hypothetical protein